MSQRSPIAALIADIEKSVASGSSEKRIATLVRVTDLFLNSADQCSEEQALLFDDVMGHLIQHVESRALVELSRRLAPIANAPPALIGTLARNDAIVISGPVLSASERLTDKDLIEIAASKSQAHLGKIAGRPRLTEAVTEVLVERGDDEVANSVAGNTGARFSSTGMAKMLLRADGDARLTESMLHRGDIPPRMLRQLMIQATETVRLKLLASASPEQKDAIKAVMGGLIAQAGKKAPAQQRDYAEAQRVIGTISQDTDLLKRKIQEFADADRVAEIVAALAVLSGFPVKDVDALVTNSNELGLTILCRAVTLEMDRAYAVIMAARLDRQDNDEHVFDDFCRYYETLSLATAQRLIRFWHGRQRVVQQFAAAAR